MSAGTPSTTSAQPLRIAWKPSDSIENVDDAVHSSHETGIGYVVSPIVLPSTLQLAQTQSPFPTNIANLKDCNYCPFQSPFRPSDLLINNNSQIHYLIGWLSSSINFNASDQTLQSKTEKLFSKELDWANHIGLHAVIMPPPSSDSVCIYASCVSNALDVKLSTQLWISANMESNTDGDWSSWNTFRQLCDHNSRLKLALNLTADLPSEVLDLERWFAEPVAALVIPTDIFLCNSKGYPVLSKRHQEYVKKWMKFPIQFILSGESIRERGEKQSIKFYRQYLEYLNKSNTSVNAIEEHAQGYEDYLQAPLQPLMDNLESATYEVFEQDPIKYQQYEKAIYHALLDKVSYDSDYECVVMVVGAGRGPIVNCALRAAEKSQRKIKLYALEKSPNAIVTLQIQKEQYWKDKVELIFSDMRSWNPPEKADILVSELLGSFGDNELSPECLDGAQKLIKADGISIPANSESFVAPLSTTKLFNKIVAYKDLSHYETPYVVKMKAVSELAEPKSTWTFNHPNTEAKMSPDNIHNSRYSKVSFEVASNALLHGFAGYFESQLYKDIYLSILPKTHTPDMFSWFPLYFPIKSPMEVHCQDKVEIHLWRKTASSKVWYEWCVQVKSASLSNGEQHVLSSAIHNVGGRSYWIGL